MRCDTAVCTAVEKRRRAPDFGETLYPLYLRGQQQTRRQLVMETIRLRQARQSTLLENAHRAPREWISQEMEKAQASLNELQVELGRSRTADAFRYEPVFATFPGRWPITQAFQMLTPLKHLLST